MRLSIAALFVLIANAVFPQCIDQTVWLNFSGDLPATPKTRRVFELQGVRNKLLINTGRNLNVYIGNKYVGGRRLVCAGGQGCQAALPGDYDHTCSNMTACQNCQYAIVSCWLPGSWAVDIDDPSSDLIAIDTQSEGAMTFSRGGRQYIVATGYDGGCGLAPVYKPTLWLIDGNELVRVGCPDFGATVKAMPAWSRMRPELARSWYGLEPSKNSSGAITGILNGAQLTESRILVVDDSNRITDWDLSGYGNQLVMTRRKGEMPGAGSHFGRGFEVGYRDGSCYLVTSTLNRSSIYSCDGNLAKIADLPHEQYQGGVAGFSPDMSFAFIGQSSGRAGYLYDITSPSNPVLISNSGATINTPPTYPYQAHADSEPYNGYLVFADYSMLMKADTSGCGVTIFADGFESGDTSKWN